MTEAIVTVAPQRSKPRELLLHALPALIGLAIIVSGFINPKLAIATIASGVIGAILAGPLGCFIGAWLPPALYLIIEGLL